MISESEEDKNKYTSPTSSTYNDNNISSIRAILNSSDKIDKLKSMNYDEILSKYYINISPPKINSLFPNINPESVEKEKDITGNNIINSLINIKNLTSSSDKKCLCKKKKRDRSKIKKNSRSQNHGLGLLLNFDVQDSEILYYPYELNTEQDQYIIYLYSIKLSNEDKISSHGFIFSLNLCKDFPLIKLISPDNHEKYYFVPLLQNGNKIEINWEKIRNCIFIGSGKIENIPREENIIEGDENNYIKI